MTADATRTAFWRSSGLHLLRRDAAGYLTVTDDFLRAYLARPEIRPVEESCDAERALHARLVDEPRWQPDAAALDALADPDARDNYRVFLGFRDLLLRHGTLEACYVQQFRSRQVTLPALFFDHMAHAILHNVLEDCDQPLRLRAAELLFRAQKVTLRDGSPLLADEDTVEMYARTGGMGSLGQLVREAQTPTRSIDLDVLDESNAEVYWARSDQFDTVLDLGFTRPGLDALCRVLEAWVGHLLRLPATVQPLQSIQDERWVWHVGLDVESTGILNDLYEGREVDEERLRLMLSLFRLDVQDGSMLRPQVAGRPIYLGLAMGADNVLRLKPQNLITNLPLAEAA
jgi:hypothetical protein